MKISHNVPALQAYNSIKRSSRGLNKATQRLASGNFINSAKDDAAGLSISNKMRMQLASIEMANRNAMDGISMTQTADGALSEVQEMVQRMRELAVEAASDVLGEDDRRKVQAEIDSLIAEIDDVSRKVQFNNIRLFGEKTRGVNQVTASDPTGVGSGGSYISEMSENFPLGELNFDIITAYTPPGYRYTVETQFFLPGETIRIEDAASAGGIGRVFTVPNGDNTAIKNAFMDFIVNDMGYKVTDNGSYVDVTAPKEVYIWHDETKPLATPVVTYQYTYNTNVVGGFTEGDSITISDGVNGYTFVVPPGTIPADAQTSVYNFINNDIGDASMPFLYNITISGGRIISDGPITVGISPSDTQQGNDMTEYTLDFTNDTQINALALGDVVKIDTVEITLEDNGVSYLQQITDRLEAEGYTVLADGTANTLKILSADDAMALSVNGTDITPTATADYYAYSLGASSLPLSVGDTITVNGVDFVVSDTVYDDFVTNFTAFAEGAGYTVRTQGDNLYLLSAADIPVTYTTSVALSETKTPIKYTYNIDLDNELNGRMLGQLSKGGVLTIEDETYTITETLMDDILAEVETWLNGLSLPGVNMSLSSPFDGSLVIESIIPVNMSYSDTAGNVNYVPVGGQVAINNASVSFTDADGNNIPVNSIVAMPDGEFKVTLDTVPTSYAIIGTNARDIKGNYTIGGLPVDADTGAITGGPLSQTLTISEGNSLGNIVLQIGPNQYMEMVLEMPEITAAALNIESLSDPKYLTQQGATEAIDICDSALSAISTHRAKFGAYENRLAYTNKSLEVTSENSATALSRIVDTDMAKEMTYYTSQSIINQAAMSIVAQANQRPQQILQLINR